MKIKWKIIRENRASRRKNDGRGRKRREEKKRM